MPAARRGRSRVTSDAQPVWPLERSRTPQRKMLADMHTSRYVHQQTWPYSTTEPLGPRLPRLPVSDGEAQRLVRASPLDGLVPGQNGVMSQNWQELAAVSTLLPDITWLGIVRESYGMVDFGKMHKRGHTALSDEGHRNRLGEKVLKLGGIDVCVRVLSLYALDERVGYNGVLDLFVYLHGARMARHISRALWFLEPDHWEKWIAPRLQGLQGHPTRQHVLNTLLVGALLEVPLEPPPSCDPDIELEHPVALEEGELAKEHILALRSAGAEMADGAELATSVFGTGGSWEELWGSDHFCAAGVRLWTVLRVGRIFPLCARGAHKHAELLLDCEDYEDEIEVLAPDFSFRDLVTSCVVCRAFDDDGLMYLCDFARRRGWTDVTFVPEPSAPVQNAKRTLKALSIVAREVNKQISDANMST